MRYNTWRRPHLGAAPQHLGASPSDPLQLPWLLPRKGPSPPEEVYLSSQAPLLTTDMDVVVRGISHWALGSSYGEGRLFVGLLFLPLIYGGDGSCPSPAVGNGSWPSATVGDCCSCLCATTPEGQEL